MPNRMASTGPTCAVVMIICFLFLLRLCWALVFAVVLPLAYRRHPLHALPLRGQRPAAQPRAQRQPVRKPLLVGYALSWSPALSGEHAKGCPRPLKSTGTRPPSRASCVCLAGRRKSDRQEALRPVRREIGIKRIDEHGQQTVIPEDERQFHDALTAELLQRGFKGTAA